MSFKEKIARARVPIGAMGGLFAGMMAGRAVDWSTLPKAALSMAVTIVVICVLWLVLPKPT